MNRMSPPAATTMSSREFNQDTGRAKKAAADGPVIITDRGEPTHVLMAFDDYRRLAGQPKTLADVLADPNAGSDDFDIQDFIPTREIVADRLLDLGND